MTFDASVVIAAMILSLTALAIIVMLTRRRLAAKEEELRQQASMRGWTLQRAREGAFRVLRWTGTTDGIAWIVESVEGQHSRSHGHKRRRLTRWRTAPGWTAPKSAALAAPIVIMGVPDGKQTLTFPAAPQGDGWAVKLAQKAFSFAFDKSLVVYFGKEAGGGLDGRAMQRVNSDSIPGYVVMAADRDATTWLLAQGLSTALTSAMANASSILSEKDRPWILLSNKSIALARMEAPSSTEQVERFVRAGVVLTRALPRSA